MCRLLPHRFPDADLPRALCHRTSMMFMTPMPPTGARWPQYYSRAGERLSRLGHHLHDLGLVPHDKVIGLACCKPVPIAHDRVISPSPNPSCAGDTCT